MKFHHRWARAALFGIAFALSSAADAALISYTSASRTLNGYASCDSCAVAPYSDTRQDGSLNPWTDAIAGSYVSSVNGQTLSSASFSMGSSALTPTGFAADLWGYTTGYAQIYPAYVSDGGGAAEFFVSFTLDATTQLRIDYFATNLRNNIDPSYDIAAFLTLDLWKGGNTTDLSGINDDLLSVHQSSTVTLGPGSYTFLARNRSRARPYGEGYSFDETAMQFSVTTVPLPGAAWLFGSGLLGLIGMARRKTA